MLADVELSGDLIQGEGLVQVVPDVVQNGGYPEKILVLDGLSGGGGVEDGGQPDEQIEQRHCLTYVATEGAVVFIPLQGLKQLDDLGHLPDGELGPAKGGVAQSGQVGLGGGQLGQGLLADVEHIPGVKALGHGAVEGALADEVQRAPAQGIHLVADKDVPRADQGEEQLTVVVEVQPAHIPGLIVV